MKIKEYMKTLTVGDRVAVKSKNKERYYVQISECNEKYVMTVLGTKFRVEDGYVVGSNPEKYPQSRHILLPDSGKKEVIREESGDTQITYTLYANGFGLDEGSIDITFGNIVFNSEDDFNTIKEKFLKSYRFNYESGLLNELIADGKVECLSLEMSAVNGSEDISFSIEMNPNKINLRDHIIEDSIARYLKLVVDEINMK